MHFMAKEKSRKRPGLEICSYFKDSVSKLGRDTICQMNRRLYEVQGGATTELN